MPAIDFVLVRDRRDELNIRNPTLASELEITTPSVENIMCGNTDPSMRVVHGLSRILTLPVSKILIGERTSDGELPDQPDSTPRPKDPSGPARRKDTEDRRTGPKRARNAEAVAS